jgi:hypothetical protein
MGKNGLRLIINFERKGLTALPPEIDCDQMAMGLPPVTSVVFIPQS